MGNLLYTSTCPTQALDSQRLLLAATLMHCSLDMCM
jgi:hypothetical protein